MTKDPAFLFYSKDWLEGTAELLPEEKGVFTDLLAHQHQKNGLPNDTKRLARLASLSHDEFLKVWATLSPKFFENDGKLFNKKLLSVTNERKEKGKRNAISGSFSQVLRKAKLEKDEYNFIRSQFKIEDFETAASENLSEILSGWVSERLAFFKRTLSIPLGERSKSIANGNANANEDEINNKGVPFFKVEVPAPNDTIPVAHVSTIGFLNVEDCLTKYITSNTYARTREMLCIKFYMQPDMLSEWAAAFTRELIARGDLSKTIDDWISHFNNWMNKQDKNKNPRKLFENEQSNTKDGKQLNAAYKQYMAEKFQGS